MTLTAFSDHSVPMMFPAQYMYIFVSKSSTFTLYMCLFAIRIGRRSKINLSFWLLQNSSLISALYPSMHAYTTQSHCSDSWCPAPKGVSGDISAPLWRCIRWHQEAVQHRVNQHRATPMLLLMEQSGTCSWVHVCCVHALCTCVYTLGLHDVAVHCRWLQLQHVVCTCITLVVVNMLSLSCILLTMNGLVHWATHYVNKENFWQGRGKG